MTSITFQPQQTRKNDHFTSSPVDIPNNPPSKRTSNPTYLLSNSIDTNRSFNFRYDLYKYKPLKSKLTKFHVFAKLPPEVRRMVWKAALPGARLLYLQTQDGYCEAEDEDEETTFEIISGIERCGRSIPLLSTTRESRSIVLEHYNVLLPQAPYVSSADDTFMESDNVFIDFEMDTLCTVLDFKLLDFLVCFPHLKIKNLALIIADLCPSDSDSWIYLLECLPQVQNLTFVLGVPKDRTMGFRRKSFGRALINQLPCLHNLLNCWRADTLADFYVSMALWDQLLLDDSMKDDFTDFVADNPQWNYVNFTTAMYVEQEDGSSIWRGFLKTEMSACHWILSHGVESAQLAHIRPMGEYDRWVAENMCFDNGRLLTPHPGPAVNITRFE